MTRKPARSENFSRLVSNRTWIDLDFAKVHRIHIRSGILKHATIIVRRHCHNNAVTCTSCTLAPTDQFVADLRHPLNAEQCIFFWKYGIVIVNQWLETNGNDKFSSVRDVFKSNNIEYGMRKSLECRCRIKKRSICSRCR
ncbi:MAG TPA: hypothetical protein VG711_10525 [Phycisphaerales bacterium]|nr:hypothetical protein [Phycisphaerales bacterium]